MQFRLFMSNNMTYIIYIYIAELTYIYFYSFIYRFGNLAISCVLKHIMQFLVKYDTTKYN